MKHKTAMLISLSLLMKTEMLPHLYDMIHPNASATATVRSLFVIGPDKTGKIDDHLSCFYRKKFC